MNTLVSSIVDFCLQKFPDQIRISPKGLVVFKEKNHGDAVFKTILQEITTGHFGEEFYLAYPNKKSTYQSRDFELAFHKELLHRLNPKKPKTDPSKKHWSKDVGYMLDEITIVENQEDVEEARLMVLDKGIHIPYDPKKIERRLDAIFGDDDEARADWSHTHRMEAVFRYRPRGPQIIRDEEIGLTYFNTYVEPTWFKGWSPPTTKPEEPKEFIALIEFMVQPHCREDFYRWFRDMIFSRAGSILVLAGSPGIGKGLLGDELVKGMVGIENYQRSKREFGFETFDARWSRCTAGFCDEITINKTNREAMKSYHSDLASVEEKHAKMGLPKEMFVSLIVANNYPSKIQLEQNDRKFFVPDLNTKKIIDSWKVDGIREFIELCKTVNFQRAVANWVYWRYAEGDSRDFSIKTRAFDYACEQSLSAWFRTLRKLLANKEVVHKKDICGRTGLRNLSALTVKDEIEIHAFMADEPPIGEVEEHADGKWSVKSLIFKGNKSEGELKV